MSPEGRAAMAARGGKAAQASGRGHRFDSETGRIAGQKGGRTTGTNRTHMSEIGKKGRAARSEGEAK